MRDLKMYMQKRWSVSFRIWNGWYCGSEMRRRPIEEKRGRELNPTGKRSVTSPF